VVVGFNNTIYSGTQITLNWLALMVQGFAPKLVQTMIILFYFTIYELSRCKELLCGVA
jgi:hypothetical protein